MRAVVLNTSAAGMTRLRGKGGASPETLYEATNCYVNASRAIQQRPAMQYYTIFPSTSRGMTVFNGVMYTFTAHAVSNPGSATVKVLIHPTPGFTGELYRIHFAQPFMGLLYVVAEFDDHVIAHYWLQEPATWQPLTIYNVNDLVQPTVPNGFYYKAVINNPPPAWQPNTLYKLGDEVQPTTYTGYSFLATNLLPQSPTTSSGTEPTWVNIPGALVLESSSGPASNVGTTAPPTPPDTKPVGILPGGKYSNPGGRFGSGTLTP
jgi:hypothetical protein